MGNKYLTLSFDDGLEQDKRIVRTLEKYGMNGCTFNINCAMTGKKGYIGRVGNIGWNYVEADQKPRDFILKYLPSFRMSKEDVRAIYQDFEIAGHEALHRMMTKLPAEELERSILEELDTLSELAGYQVTGYAYPFGANNGNVRNVLKACGVSYARTVREAKSFRPPEDPLCWNANCSFISSKLFDKLESFLGSSAAEDTFFSVWGHGYEFDFGTKEANWEKLDRFCRMVSEARDVICCTNRDFFDKVKISKD